MISIVVDFFMNTWVLKKLFASSLQLFQERATQILNSWIINHDFIDAS